MHVTQRELLDDFLAFVNENGDSTARSTAAGVLNRAMTAIWLKRAWSAFRSPVPFQLTLVVNQARYALPDYFGRVGPGDVRNLTRGGSKVAPRRQGGMDHDYPWYGTSDETAGTPLTYEIAGTTDVHTQPLSTGEALEVLSDQAADVDIVCAIAGDDSTGTWTRNQVTLNGTTPVSIGTWAFVDEFAKAYQASSTPVTSLTSSRGNVILRKSSDQTELEKLFPQESSREHAVFTVYPKPSSADVLAIPITRRPKRLLHDADVVPDLWVPALLEEMVIQWQVNSGEMSPERANSSPRPAFLDLSAHENAIQPPGHVRPYSRR